MRGFLLRLAVVIVVLGLTAIWLININVWPKVVDAVGAIFGGTTAHEVDQFGKTSKKVGDDTSSAISKAYADGKAHPSQSEYSNALRLLGTVGTTSGARIPTYQRSAFGPAWADVDGNHCDTRDDILARDLKHVTKSGACTVKTGILNDPYTGKTINFVRGARTSTAVQIDHVDPLARAWADGAWSWTPQQREDYANDPAVLLAVDGPSNETKGDSGPSGWLPPDASYRCDYVTHFVTIVVKYGLTMTADDKATSSRVLAACS